MSIIDPPAGWPDVDGIDPSERLLGGVSGPLNRAVGDLTARSKQLRDWREADVASVAADKTALASAIGATLVGWQRESDSLNVPVSTKITQLRPRHTDYGTADDQVNRTLGTSSFQKAMNAGQAKVPRGRYYVDGLTSRNGLGITADKIIAGTVNTTSGIIQQGSWAEISNIQIECAHPTNYALNLQVGDGSAFGHLIKDVRIAADLGVYNESTETKIWNTYIRGTWANGTGPIQGQGIRSALWDLSLFGVEIEDCRIGLNTTHGCQGTDVHVVRADTAFNVVQQGQPAQFTNTYVDTARLVGINLQDMSGSCWANTYFLNLGRYADSTATAAINFTGTSNYNNIMGVWLNGDPNKAATTFAFSSTAKDNLLLGVGGTYKQTGANTTALRRQTMVACHGGWARHNNIVRQNRGITANVAAGASVTLDIVMDWAHPSDLTGTTVLLTGTWNSKANTNLNAFGRLYVPVHFGDSGSSPVIEKLSGSTTIVWAITSATILDDVLTLTLQNTGTATARIAVELARTVDSNALCF